MSWWDVFCLKNYKDISSLCSLLLQAIQKQIQTQIKYNSESVWKTTDASPPSLSVHFLSGDFCFPPPLCIFPVQNLPAYATHISADDQVKNCSDKCRFVQISCVATWISAGNCALQLSAGSACEGTMWEGGELPIKSRILTKCRRVARYGQSGEKQDPDKVVKYWQSSKILTKWLNIDKVARSRQSGESEQLGENGVLHIPEICPRHQCQCQNFVN